MSADMIRVTDEQITPPAPETSPAAPPAISDNPNDVYQEIQDAIAAAQVTPPAQPQAPPAVVEPSTPEVPTPQVGVTATPVAEPAPDTPSPPDPYSYQRLEEIAQLPEDQRAAESVAFVKSRAQFDPIVHAAERFAMYEAERATYERWYLEDHGITPDKIGEFVSWMKAGAQALPQPATPAPFPEFPQADTDGFVVIGGVRYDTADEYQMRAAREAYEDKKFIYDAKIEKQQQELQKTEQAKADAHRRQQEQAAAQARIVEQRMEEFGNQRTEALIKVLDPIMPKFAPGDEWMEEVYIHVIKGTLGHLENAVDAQGNPATELGRLSAEAHKYVPSGAGKKDALGREIDRVSAIEVRKKVDQLNRFFLKANKAEAALAATQPQVPANPQTVVTSPTPPPPPTGSDQFMKDTMAEIAQALGHQR